MSSWEIDRQQQRDLISCSSSVVTGFVVVVAEDAGAVLFYGSGGGGLCRLWGDLDHLEELVGELRDVLEPLGRPFGPRVFAVALYLAWGRSCTDRS